MFGISFAELMIIGLLVLVVLGPEKLPEVARWAGKGLRELRQLSNTMRDALMIDDLSGTTRSHPSSMTEKNSPALPSANMSDPSDPDAAGPAMNEPYPTASTAHPAGLDQFDDGAFDKMLEEQYRLHHNEIRNVSLSLQKESTDIIEIPLERVNKNDLDMVDISIAPSSAIELSQ